MVNSRPLFAAAALLLNTTLSAQGDVTTNEVVAPETRIFHSGVRLEANGAPINIGKLSKFSHAGPCLADVDGDGDRDLVVGDFPGYFWLFENTGTDAAPSFVERGKLQAGGADAKTPVY